MISAFCIRSSINCIEVTIEDGVSSADQIKTALDGDVDAAALIDVTVSGTGIDPQDVFTPAKYLIGGLGDKDIKLDIGEGNRFDKSGLIDIISGVDGNTSSDTQLVVINTYPGTVNSDIITVDQVVSAASIGDFVIGHAPENYLPLTSETALLGLKGTFTVAGFVVKQCELISAEISVTNNYTKKDFGYGTSKICGYIPDKRRNVGVKLDVLLNKDNFSFYMRSKKFTAEEITITLEPQDIPSPSFDSSVGRTLKFYMPRVEFNIPPIENPGDQYVTLSLEGVAMAESMDNLDSELTLTIE